VPPAKRRRLRVCLDLNVFVSAEIARHRSAWTSPALRLVEACRAGEVDLIVSSPMLERLAEVLTRSPLKLTPVTAQERVDLIAEYAALRSLLVAGTGVYPFTDLEDRTVLEAALAGQADYLATYNLKHFAPAAIEDPATGLLCVGSLLIVDPPTLRDRIRQ
jgi:predicted nucleic acid-binding protein